MDSEKLAGALAFIDEQNLALQSLLVIRHGYIVSETYYDNYHQDITHELYSCTKSFTATLVGIALDKGFIDGLDHLVLDYFPEYTHEDQDALKRSMKLEDLLTMTSGFDWLEADRTYTEMYQSSDWVSYVLDIPMVAKPDSTFNYCSGCSHLLSAIVDQATHMNTKDFADQYLLEPLGISGAVWQTDTDGIPIGGWGLQLTPRQMAKLGYLYLHEGQWDGQQIVSAEWVKTAIQKHTTTDDELGYGYQWWIYPRHNAYTALGRFGQTIFVVPDSDLIIVTTAGSLDNHNEIFDLIEDFILPAVQDS